MGARVTSAEFKPRTQCGAPLHSQGVLRSLPGCDGSSLFQGATNSTAKKEIPLPRRRQVVPHAMASQRWARLWPRWWGAAKSPGTEHSNPGRELLHSTRDKSCWATKVGRRKESHGPGFPPDVWRAHMIDGICLLLY